MIITVTLNPAIDKTVRLDCLRVGELNRIQSIREDAGGKGINVSKTIKSLGGESLALGFLGGMAGWQIESCLDKLFIRHSFVRITSSTRTNQKIVPDEGEVTEINEPGPNITSSEKEHFLSDFSDKVKMGDIVILSGSLPGGIPADFYAQLTNLAHEKGAFVFADADGETLREVVKARPDVVKPNFEELCAYLEKEGLLEKAREMARERSLRKVLLDELAHDEDREKVKLSMAMALLVREMGVREVIVSMGSLGALFVLDDTCYFAPALTVKVHSTVGAGDALLAAYAYASERGIRIEDKIRLAISVSAGAVTTEGTSPASKGLVQDLSSDVKILRLGAL